MILVKGELRPLVQSGLVGEEQFQPAGIDLTVKTVEVFSSTGVIDFSNEKRTLPMTQMLDFDVDGRLYLPRGVYRVQVDPILKIPMDCVGFALPRSSLTRMGCSIQGGFWDPGYEGDAVFSLLVQSESGLVIYKDARIAQIVMSRTTVALGDGEGYDGVYQGHGIAKVAAENDETEQDLGL